MAIPVEAPKLGNTVEECIVSRWRKQKGDCVSAGEVILDLETDKTVFEVPSPADGTILELFFEEGALVPVFTNLCVIGKPGESFDRFRPSAAVLQTPAPSSQTVPAPAIPEALEAAPGAPAGNLSPRARRFAREHHFTPPHLAGSGPGGRVMEEDVRRAYHGLPSLARPGARPHSPAAAPAKIGQQQRFRETTARRMRESLSSTAQYTLHTSAKASGLLRLRATLKSRSGGPDITINDLVLYCTVRALLEVPELNAELIGGELHRHRRVHLGFACDTNRGLLVPVIRDSDSLALADLSAKAKELAARAIQGNIFPDDLSGATFTVSNLGSLGIESFTPILNPPQVGILGVNAISLKPIRVDGEVRFIDSIGLSLTCDHQVIDGAPGARFLKVLGTKIENVEHLCTI